MSMPKNWRPKFEDAEPRCPDCVVLEAERDALLEERAVWLNDIKLVQDRNLDMTKRIMEKETMRETYVLEMIIDLFEQEVKNWRDRNDGGSVGWVEWNEILDCVKMTGRSVQALINKPRPTAVKEKDKGEERAS